MTEDGAQTFDITTFDAGHLKHVINTNEDPFRCAGCTEVLDYCSFVVHACCGKSVVCTTCDDAPTKKPERWSCLFCGGNPCYSVGTAKKHAKRGRAWSQSSLARAYYHGDGITESRFEALRWYRKAAANNHPISMLGIAQHCLHGDGCEQDLLKAKELSLKARQLDPRVTFIEKSILVDIGWEHQRLGQYREAEQILRPLADEGDQKACLGLAGVLSLLLENENALPYFVKAATHAASDSSDRFQSCHVAMCFSYDLKQWCQTRLWMLAINVLKGDFCLIDDDVAKDAADDICRTMGKLRCLRQTCAECGAGLDVSSRKLCKQCKTYCYCSRACQKKHWNKKKDGHREECMGVLDLKKKMADAMKS